MQAPAYVKMPSTHAGKLERYLGPEGVAQLQKAMQGWYYKPIHLLDVPGSVRVAADGDFVGRFVTSRFEVGLDRVREALVRASKPRHGVLNAGFVDVSDALNRASQGFRQQPGGNITKVGTTGVVGASNTLWRVGNTPAGGGAGSAAPGGRACSSTTNGAMRWTNPAAGTMRLTGADFSANIINNSVLIYDRIFDVAKTMSSTANEAVTGVPTRYQSSTTTSEEYAGGNFCFVEAVAALGATAHEWGVAGGNECLYRNQAGTDNSIFPVMTGNASCIQDRLDHPLSAPWFFPPAAGDTGVMDLAQLRCSASVTGTVNFVLGHPLGFMSFPVINSMLPFDWLTNRDQAPYISNSACLALLEVVKPATTATTYTGRIYGTSTSS